MTVSRGDTSKVRKELRVKKTRRLWFPIEKAIGDNFPLT